jgi:hypothetical protein
MKQYNELRTTTTTSVSYGTRLGCHVRKYLGLCDYKGKCVNWKKKIDPPNFEYYQSVFQPQDPTIRFVYIQNQNNFI